MADGHAIKCTRPHENHTVCPLPDIITHEHTHELLGVGPTGSEGKNSYRVPIKYRFDLIPPIFLRQLAEVYEEGAQNYGDAKYIESPLPASVIINHLLAHLLEWCEGDRSELHLAKVAWACASLTVLDDLYTNRIIDWERDVSKHGSHAVEAVMKNHQSRMPLGSTVINDD